MFCRAPERAWPSAPVAPTGSRRSPESLEGPTLVREVDVSDEGQAREFIQAAHDELGGLHILVNNAGLMLLGPVADAETEDWRRMIAVNLLGLLYCTHAALPLLASGGGGDIVNISSVAGRRADAGAAVYNMTKFGVHAFSEALRQEALHQGIRVTTVAPGFVETELQGHNTNPLVRQAMERHREQIGEVLHADDIAEAILHSVTRPRARVRERGRGAPEPARPVRPAGGALGPRAWPT